MSITDGTRQAYLLDAPTDLTDEEREVWWVVKWIQHRDWMTDPAECAKLEQSHPKRQRHAIRECSEALAVLRRHLDIDAPVDELRGPYLWIVDQETAGATHDALNHVQQLLIRLESEITDRKKLGNTPDSAGMFIRMLWPVLNRHDHKQRASARILSAAFMQVGITDKDTSSSIRQTIGLLERTR